MRNASEGPLVIDSDGHVMEPLDLWARYLPSSLASRAPHYDGMIMMLDGVAAWIARMRAKDRDQAREHSADQRHKDDCLNHLAR